MGRVGVGPGKTINSSVIFGVISVWISRVGFLGSSLFTRGESLAEPYLMEPSIGSDGAYPRMGHNVSRRSLRRWGGG